MSASKPLRTGWGLTGLSGRAAGSTTVALTALALGLSSETSFENTLPMALATIWALSGLGSS